jgi:hypothetical protein
MTLKEYLLMVELDVFKVTDFYKNSRMTLIHLLNILKGSVFFTILCSFLDDITFTSSLILLHFSP